MLNIKWITLGWLILLISNYATANDSIARVGVGGITLIKNDKIRMIQEILEISTKAVKVRYQFLNESKDDIHATVAFPMPSYGWNPGFSESMRNVGPLASFNIWANGRQVPTKKNKVAYIHGVDVTNQLRKIGLTNSQIFETFGDCVANDDETYKCGLSEVQELEITKLINDRHSFRWQVSETAYWDQLFPAGKKIEVIHEYPPFVGSSYAFSSGAFIRSKNLTEACIDGSTDLAVTKRVKTIKDKKGEAAVTLQEVEYILGTGRNWKGSIKDFKLIIKKESPSQIVSLCFPGKPKRTSPTTIEFSQLDFVPQDKLVIYFYTVEDKVLSQTD